MGGNASIQVPKPNGLPNLVFHHMNRIQLSVVVDTKTVRRCAVPRKHLRDLLKGKVVDIDITYITVSKLDHDGGTVSKQRQAPPMDTQALLQYFSPLRVVSCSLGHVTVNGVKVPNQTEWSQMMQSELTIEDFRMIVSAQDDGHPSPIAWTCGNENSDSDSD